MKRLPRGELEAQIMNVLWDSDEWMTPAAVKSSIDAPGRKLAYTTVTTILVRLWHKHMLEREPAGRAFAYRPAASRDEYAAQRMRELLDASGDQLLTLNRFVQSMTPREADELRQAIRNQRKR